MEKYTRIGQYLIVNHSTGACVYEPSSYRGPHHGLFTYDGQVWGDITTRRPVHLDKLTPGTDQRVKAVKNWYDYRRVLADEIIKLARAETYDLRGGISPFDIAAKSSIRA